MQAHRPAGEHATNLDAVASEHGAVTRVVAAHRLATIRRADRIAVMSAGRIVQTGTFDELAAGEGPFRELIERQSLDPIAAPLDI